MKKLRLKIIFLRASVLAVVALNPITMSLIDWELTVQIFIEKNNIWDYKVIQSISVNAALSKMDSKSFPLIDLYCEDDEAKKIIEKWIHYVSIKHKLNNFKELINIIGRSCLHQAPA